MGKKKTSKVSKIQIVLSIFLLITAGALSVAARMAEGFAEWYSTTIYPFLVASLGWLSGIIPFSFAEALIIILAAVIVLDLIIERHRFRRFLIHLILIISVLAFMYSANCGVNYYRNPFVDQSVYEDAQFEVSLLEDYCEYIISNLEETSETGQDSGDSAFSYPDDAEIARIAAASMTKLSADYPELKGYYPNPKFLRLTAGLFSSMGVSGIYSPFTIEANVNGQMQDMEKPFTACHELSHLRGYMNEGEANYIGWLASINSDDPAFRRSGWLVAWNYAGSTLNRMDPEKFAALYEKLPDDAVRELVENHEFWAENETGASEIQDKVNDAYLKSNGVEEGVSSYGQLTTLMLLWYQQEQTALQE